MAGYGEAPQFWWRRGDWRGWLLWPVSAIYGAVAAYRMRRAPRVHVAAPVICIGNLTVGGEGKTPIAIALARQATAMGLRPGILSRGYGGHHTKPHKVNSATDSARIVGDEPLLLARHAVTVVGRDRVACAEMLIESGCNFLIMDDGFQSAHLQMDYALIVVDMSRGFGNGHVLPGGPLRAPLLEQVRHITGVVTMGRGDGGNQVVRHASRAGRSVFQARIEPLNGEDFQARRVLAFAGIGNPEKFYVSLRQSGAEVVETRSFGDHYPYSPDDIAELLSEAERQGLDLVTTEKDLVRIEQGSHNIPDETKARISALAVAALFEDGKIPERIIRETLATARLRMATTPKK